MSSPTTEPTDRRSFLSRIGSLGLVTSLVAAYGGFAAVATRFLYPAKKRGGRWFYVATIDEIPEQSSFGYETPSGASIVITRPGAEATVDSFRALSDVCPHLGCKVHWQGKEQHYFCPCHNGTFNAAGIGTGGPPGDQGLTLPGYNLRLDGNLLMIELSDADLQAKRKVSHA